MLIHSVELLLNLNAFGFLREGCRLLGLELRGETEEPAEYDPDVSSPDRLDGIAGGVYWRDILERYYAGGIKWHQAEAEFVTCYCARMRELFKYVINIPIKEKMDHTPKYRIVFGTNHEDGLLLMADNMSRRWDEFRDSQRNGQSPLFEIDFPDPSKLDFRSGVEDGIRDSIGDDEVELKQLLIHLVERYGIAFPTSKYVEILKGFAVDRAVTVRRDPKLTPTGRHRSGWAHDSKDYIVYISKAQQWQPNLL